MIDPSIDHQQVVVDLTKKVTGRDFEVEVDRQAVGPHEAPGLALFRSGILITHRYVLSKWMRTIHKPSVGKRTT